MFKAESQDKKAEVEFFARIVEEGKVVQVCPWNKCKLERALGYLRELGYEREKSSKVRVLDLGCGPGDFTRHLIDMGFSPLGIDISRDLLKINKERNPDAFFVCGDAEDLPFNDASFDIVVCTFVLHHFNVHKQIINEAYRVMKHEGIFISVEPNSWNPVTWYQHNLPFGKKKHEDSINERIFGLLYLKRFLSQWFEVLEWKTINFDFIKVLTPLEGIFERLFPVNLFGGSIVLYGRKKIK
ncbi:class I SAM-dependent methyltransferase [Candidatus Desantisbacteria bacterium]|nr:class I SAM-dependent methyltransferase [Candidatus Desantisbacteria bacterium]